MDVFDFEFEDRESTPQTQDLDIISDELDTSMADQEQQQLRDDLAVTEAVEATPLLEHTVNSGKLSCSDFEIKKLLGEGAFGKVFQVRKKNGTDAGHYFAMKVLKKATILGNQKDTDHTRSERYILEAVKHPFIVELVYAFQTEGKLYLILEYLSGGDLFTHFQRLELMMENPVHFYACEIVLALEYLHDLDIIYRDLKPQNVMLDVQGHIKLIDFGLSKEHMVDHEMTNTLCGTIEFMAPEILAGLGHVKAVDWWSLGALMYFLLIGNPPFVADTREKLTHAILEARLVVPTHLRPETADLIRQLLKRHAILRLGGGPLAKRAVRAHAYFKNVSWDDVLARRLKPPIIPHLESKGDVSNFDERFTEQPALDSPVESQLSRSKDSAFEGFTYVAPAMLEEMAKATIGSSHGQTSHQNGTITNRSDQNSPFGAGPSNQDETVHYVRARNNESAVTCSWPENE